MVNEERRECPGGVRRKKREVESKNGRRSEEERGKGEKSGGERGRTNAWKERLRRDSG